jgi:hypothetical protein
LRDDRDRTSFYRFSPTDIVMAMVVLLVSASALFWMGARDARGADGATATVLRGDTVIETVPLSADGILRLRDVGMTLEVQSGRIRVVESDCPHDVCVHTGWIGSSGEVIACVPNRVIIRVDGPEEPFLDAIVR